jgi:hypothetical protein
MRTTLQPPGHTALQSLPAPRDALMQADAPLMAYLAQWFACWLPASGTRPSNRDLAGRQAVDGSPPPTGRSGTERRRDDDAQAPPGGGRLPRAHSKDGGRSTRGRYSLGGHALVPSPWLGPSPHHGRRDLWP